MTMMALAKTKLHLSINLLTKDLSLLELNQKFSTHIHTSMSIRDGDDLFQWTSNEAYQRRL